MYKYHQSKCCLDKWQLESFLDVPRNLPVKFHQNRVSNSWDIADVELWANVTWTNVAWTNVTMESVLDVPMNLHLKFHQNRVSNSWDIANIEFLWWWWGVVGGWFAKSFSCLTQLKVMLGWVELWLSWGFDNLHSRTLSRKHELILAFYIKI